MKRLLSLLGRLLHPAWWRARYGDQFTDLVESASPAHRHRDLLVGVAKLERKRWTPRRMLAACGIRIERRNSDFMLDVFKTLHLEYAAANSGTTVLALHESIVNYGGNVMPEFLTCLHEESAVALADGYARMAGKPMLVLLHGSVGLQHAAMAIHHANADRVPVCLVVGNGARGFRAHNARDLARMVREDLKWDDEPKSVDEFAASAMRAYKIAMTPPMGPVLLVLDQLMQESPFTRLHLEIPKFVPTTAPQADRGAIEDAAHRLVSSARPLIVAQRAARTPACLDLLVELAETIQAPVRSFGWLNFPNRHPLAGSGGRDYQPDLVLLLETGDLPAAVTAAWPEGAQLIRMSAASLSRRAGFANPETEIDIYGDAEATLPALIAECKSRISPDRKPAIEQRGRCVADQHRRERQAWLQQAADGADTGPVSVSRLCAEIWPLIEEEDWSLVSCDRSTNLWPRRLWNFDRHHRFIGELDRDGRGVNAPVAVGAALANRKHGRLSINLQTDTDLMYSPGVLWTAAHHKIPLLTVTLNARAVDGARLAAPDIHFAQLGKSLGMLTEGPIGCLQELRPALRRGIERVKQGEPVLIEIGGRDSA